MAELVMFLHNQGSQQSLEPRSHRRPFSLIHSFVSPFLMLLNLRML